MLDFIKSLSPTAEFVIVITIGFGYSIYSSVMLFLCNMLGLRTYTGSFTNESLIVFVLYEIIIIVVLYYFLKIRGSAISFTNKTSIFLLIGSGILLLLIYYLIYELIFLILSFIVPNIVSYAVANSQANKLSLIAILMVSIVNPVFEEVLVTNYVITTLLPHKGILYAVNVSILIRFLYHLYQGPMAAISIIPMGVIFAFVYLKWKNIWPLIIAHGIADLIAFLSYYYF